MKIAIIGTGNVGGALAGKWAEAGHELFLGVQDPATFDNESLSALPNTTVHGVAAAVEAAAVVLLATPALATIKVTQSLGDTTGKTIIDAMNIVMGKGPEGYTNTTDAILANTASTDVVKCFNTTGYNNIVDTGYHGIAIDTFVCGDSLSAKKVAAALAADAGFGSCIDVGGNEHFSLMEQFAWFWINLAGFQGQGRDIAFKLLRR